VARHESRKYFAEWLTRTLWEREISGGEIAKAVGVNDSAISRWKNGKATPGLDSVMKLAAFLEVDPIALGVTAGLMKEGEVGVKRLPLPEGIKAVSVAEEWIRRIPGITDEDRTSLLQTINERYPK